MRRWVLWGVTVAMVLTACGDAGGDTQPPPPTTAPGSTTSSTGVAPPQTSVTTQPPETVPLTTATTGPPRTTTTSTSTTTTSTPASTSSTTSTTAPDSGAPTPVATDFLIFVAGAVPLSIGGTGAQAGVDFNEAVQAVDGSARKVVLNSVAAVAPDVDFVFALPAVTTFTRFAIPRMTETPSASHTGIKDFEILASNQGPSTGFSLIASGSLKTGAATEVDEFIVSPPVAARWIKLRLLTGQEAGATFFEFTEIIGNGTQAAVPLSGIFNGIWNTSSARVELRQSGAVVTGCYDNGAGPVNGTVTGNIATLGFYHATSGATGAMVVTVDGDGALRGIRTDEGGAFRTYTGTKAASGATTPCSADPVPDDPIGDALDDHCRAILHGINFDFASAVIRSDSAPIIEQLRTALLNAPTLDVDIVGHTSSEGSDAYNLDLSLRRAQAVVQRMVGLGIASTRFTAVGKGEAEPIADNDTEAGRRLNRRVEVLCG